MPAEKIVTIVPCLGKPELTRECLRSLTADPDPSNTVLVVENGTMENIENLGPEFPDVHFLNLKQNEGFAGGINYGMKFALREWNPDFFFLLNNDATVRRGAIPALIQTMRDNPDCGMVAPKIWSDREETTLWAAGGEFIPWRFMARNRGQGTGDRVAYNRLEECTFLSGCAVLIRRRLIESVGLMDQDLFTYAEDLDYCLRARKERWKLLYNPKAVVIHEGSTTSGGQYEPFQSFYRWRNRLIVASKRAGVFHRTFLFGFFFPLLMARDLTTYLRKKRIGSIPYLWRGFHQFVVLCILKKNVEPLRSAPPGRNRLNAGYLMEHPLAILAFKAIDGLGKIIFTFTKKKRLPADPQKILVAKIDHLGDVLMSLHVIPAIKKKFPRSRIDFVCGSWSRGVVENHPMIGRVIPFDHYALNRDGSFFQRLKKFLTDFIAVVRKTRRERYDIALDLRGYYPNFLPVLAFIHAEYKLAYSTAGFGFVLDDTRPWREGIHETEHFYDLLSAVNPQIERENADFGYLVDSKRTAGYLHSIGFGNGKPFVVIHAFCQKSFLRDQKHWRMGEWKKTITWLEKEGFDILCTGDSEDETPIREMTVGSRAVNGAGKTPLEVLSGVLGRSSFSICVDTFVSHLSAAMNVKTIVLFNQVEPVEQWKPWGNRTVFLPIESKADDVILTSRSFLNQSKGVLSNG